MKRTDTLYMIRGMAMKRHSQYGLSLVELLATLAILSIIGVLVWGVFFQGTEYSNKAFTKNQMQQEANIIVAKLTKIHQTHKPVSGNESYEILSTDGKITIKYNDKAGNRKTEVIENSHHSYSTDSVTVNPEIENEISLTVTIKDDKTGESLSIRTTLYRLGGGS